MTRAAAAAHIVPILVLALVQVLLVPLASAATSPAPRPRGHREEGGKRRGAKSTRRNVEERGSQGGGVGGLGGLSRPQTAGL